MIVSFYRHHELVIRRENQNGNAANGCSSDACTANSIHNLAIGVRFVDDPGVGGVDLVSMVGEFRNAKQ